MSACALHIEFEHAFGPGAAMAIAFDAAPGVTALFGPSGSGKTTTLEVIAGLLSPQRGTVRLGEETWVDTDRGVNLARRRRQVGYIPQDELLFPHMSVRANLAFGAGRGATDPGLARIIEVLELGDLLDRKPSTLSGGQRQRVALGRAAARQPRVLLLDEPVSALDARLKRRVLDDLCRLVAELAIPAIFVSHDQVDVRRFAREVVLVEGGRVVGAGPTGNVLDQATGRWGVQTRENIVQVTGIEPASGGWRGDLGGRRVSLPATGEWTPTAWITFGAHDVTLAAGDHAELRSLLSPRNRWPGRVLSLDDRDGRVFVALDVGQPIWAEITPEAREAMALKPGGQVVCLVKAAALRRLDGGKGT